MSILNVSGGLGFMAAAKGWMGESTGRVQPGRAVVHRALDLPTRKVWEDVAVASVREVDRSEEDCERWDGLS